MLGESPIDCALREGQEETGINFADYRSKLREVTYGRTPAHAMAYFVYDNVTIKNIVNSQEIRASSTKLMPEELPKINLAPNVHKEGEF